MQRHRSKLLGQREPLDKIKTRSTQDKHLTVHIIPHTHDDVGWAKTVEEYYTGAQPEVHASGEEILDAVSEELAKDPRRRFTYVEMKFFSMWYKQQDKKTKELVKKLIQSGQLEITQGGWVATDEACPNYEDLILNMHIGHQFLWDEFQVRPKVGWMLDAFGHSEANAALFSDFGFEVLYFTRVNPELREQFKKDKMLHFLWTPFSSQETTTTGPKKQILVHINTQKKQYDYLPLMDYEANQYLDDPLITNKDFLDYNFQSKCIALINTVQAAADE